ncbi:acyl-CoA dehydrogenase family protein [Streptomyces sp. NPDC017991]|uniref:acyl-CoA dehydrogenase family protein n=1 Tax=Streptomyces sp. NPDC017991 TaxID=3365026 RepID=UPI003796E2BA
MAIDFTLSPEQRELQRHARKVAGEVLGGVRETMAGLHTPEERFAATRPVYRELVRAGLLRKQIPPAFGGTMTTLLDLALVAEELWAVDADVPLSLFSTGLGLMPLLMFGSPEQQQRLLPPFVTDDGEPLAALAFSEPGGSANFQSAHPGTGIGTVARRDGDTWVISGEKQFIPHASGWDGQGADLFTVAARTDLDAPPQESLAVFLVRRPERGLTVLNSMETIGHRGALVSRVRFDEVRVPAADLLGRPGDGIGILEAAFSATAGLVGAFSVGIMRSAFESVLDFARTERRGGTVPVIEHQNVGTLLADMKARLEACRYLTWKACDYFDTTSGRGTELSLATKVFASETAVQVVYDGMRAVGAEAYTTARPLAGLLQDVLAYPLFDGGNVGVRRPQLQRLFAQDGYDPLAAAEERAPGE